MTKLWMVAVTLVTVSAAALSRNGGQGGAHAVAFNPLMPLLELIKFEINCSFLCWFSTAVYCDHLEYRPPDLLLYPSGGSEPYCRVLFTLRFPAVPRGLLAYSIGHAKAAAGVDLLGLFLL